MRLPPHHAGGSCACTSLRGIDKQTRVNINTVLDTYGPSPGDADLESNSSAGHRPCKQKRIDGIEWSQVKYTTTLGDRPRDFILWLASYCKSLDVQQVIRDIISVYLPPANTGTLVALTNEYELHAHNNNMTKFWQAVIEIQVALRCERSV